MKDDFSQQVNEINKHLKKKNIYIYIYIYIYENILWPKII